jgi:uncharacterized protein YegJ (DUF2314 family)
MTLRLAIMAAAAVGLVACGQADSAQPLSEKMIYTDGGVALDKARAEAVRTLPTFWSKFYAKAPDTSDFALKVKLATDDGRGSEYIWAEPIRQTGDVVVVRLINEPVHVKALKYGSEVRSKVSDIWDWAYMKNERLYGHFTTRVLVKEASPQERAEFEALVAPTPLEADAK